ncbi:MAG: RDD family protein, partial [Kineosporiaceae bacterium]
VPAQAGPWGTAPGAQPTWGPPGLARKGAVLVGGTSYECAPWRLRVASSLVDGLVVGVVSGMVSVVNDTLGNVAWLLVVLANTVYLQGTTGQTLGKRAVGTHLVRKVRSHPGTEQLVAPGMGTAFLRRIAQVLDSLSLGIGYLAPLWTQRRQTFGDMLTQTVVIKASGPLSLSPAGPSDQSAAW